MGIRAPMAPATATPRPTTIWGPPTKTASFSTHVGVVRKSGKKQSANNGRVHRWAGRNGVNGSYGPIEIGAQERNRARTKTPERVVSSIKVRNSFSETKMNVQVVSRAVIDDDEKNLLVD